MITAVATNAGIPHEKNTEQLLLRTKKHIAID